MEHPTTNTTKNKEPIEDMREKFRRYLTGEFVKEFESPQFGQKCYQKRKYYRFEY